MLFGVVSNFDVVCNLSSLRMTSVITSTGRGEDEIAKDRTMRFIQKCDEDIGAFARGNFGALFGLARALNDRRSSTSPWIPGMYVGSRLGDGVRFDEGDIVLIKNTSEMTCSATEAVA